MPNWTNRFRLAPESDSMLTFDTLRFVAALGIVFHHSNAFLFSPEFRLSQKEESWGLALFVDLFFVISGYVIAHVYGGRTNSMHSFLQFIQKRIARLLPLHLIVLLVFTAIYFAAQFVGFAIGTPPDLSPLCLLKTALLLHAIAPCDGPAVNPVSWSISAEMVMYVCFPVLFLVLGRNRQIAALGLFLSTAAILTMSWGLTAHEWTDLYSPVRALPSFCFGICLFRVLSKISDKQPIAQAWWNFLLVALVLLLAASMMKGAAATPLLILVLIVCSVSAAIDKSGMASGLTRRTACFGQLTYAVYMIHLIIVTAIVNVVADKTLHLSYWPMLGAILIALVLVLIVSLLSYSLIETPARRWLSPKRGTIL